MSGIFGIVSKKNCTGDLYRGTDYNSHKGQAFGGIAVLGKHPITHELDAQFKSKFKEILIEYAGAKSGIGVISADERQPLEVYSNFGKFSICMDGRIFNIEEITSDLLSKGASITQLCSNNEEIQANPIALAGKIIAEEKGIISGIERLFDMVEGSISVLLLNEKGIYAARTKYGQSPLIVGKKQDSLAVTGEPCAFKNLGYHSVRELEPGEIVLLTENGLIEKNQPNNQSQICSFLWVYTGNPASTYERENVEIVRERCGRAIARRDMTDNIKIDFVSGVPDSGIAHAIGYSNETQLPFRRPLIKYTDGYGRSYIALTQKEKNKVAELKLIPIDEIIKGASFVVMEDSMVRGTQLKNNTLTKLWDAGAKAIHLRTGCPPILFPCKYNISIRDLDELAARKAIKKLTGKFEPDNIEQFTKWNSAEYRAMVEMIRTEELRDKSHDYPCVTSLRFQRLEDMVEAIGLPKERLCTYCFDGKGVE